MTDNPRTYTAREVANLFRVHIRSVARWNLSYYIEDGKRRYYADPIDEMTKSKRGPDA